MANFMEMEKWDESSDSLWVEIVDRWGGESYADKTIRAEKLIILKAEYEVNKYKRDRKAEYPAIGDQLDMIYHNGDGGATFQAAIKAVKDKYPK
jgi:hypothetical protein